VYVRNYDQIKRAQRKAAYYRRQLNQLKYIMEHQYDVEDDTGGLPPQGMKPRTDTQADAEAESGLGVTTDSNGHKRLRITAGVRQEPSNMDSDDDSV